MTDLDKRLDKIEQKLDEVAVRSAALQFPDPRFSASLGGRSDEIDLRELWNVIWQGKWLIVGVTFVFAVASVIYALSLPNIYKSEALLAPAEENSGGGLAGMAGQLGGLASLAGISLGGGGSDKTALALEVLKSRQFIAEFITKHNLLVPLVAAKGWDRDQNELLIDSEVYDQKINIWVRPSKPPRGAEPTMQEAYKIFLESFSVSQDKKSNFVSVSIQHYSPFVAKQWVEFLVKGINDEIKARDVAEAKKSIEYLSSQITKTSIADMQSIFYELIEEQWKTILFAEVRDEYVFRTIDKAVVPESKDGPFRLAYILAGGVFGLVVTLSLVVLLLIFRREN